MLIIQVRPWLRVVRLSEGGYLRQLDIMGEWLPDGLYASLRSAIDGPRR